MQVTPIMNAVCSVSAHRLSNGHRQMGTNQMMAADCSANGADAAVVVGVPANAEKC